MPAAARQRTLHCMSEALTFKELKSHQANYDARLAYQRQLRFRLAKIGTAMDRLPPARLYPSALPGLAVRVATRAENQSASQLRSTIERVTK